MAVILILLAGLLMSCTDDDDDTADDDVTDDDAYDDDAIDDDVADDDLVDDDIVDDDFTDDDTLPDDDAVDDDSVDDDSVDDDSADDDSADDDTVVEPTPEPNPNAKADAFKLFYRERSERALLSINRFALAGDAVAANAFGKSAIAKDGDEWEVVAGPEGNNPFGKTAFAAWKLYQAIGGRELELTLIRMFEGIVFNEAISGHPGLTTREAFPGWTRTMDGIGQTVTRTKWEVPVTPPVTYSPTLEQEILDTFYDGVVFTYRENPEEYLFNFKAVNELADFSVTFVFDELDHDPPFLRVSDCCSSFMVSQMGTWEGAYWGNQNSRDNFTDYALGFLAAFEAEATDGLPADLALAAQRAAEAARRTGDNIIEHDNMLMTVDEWHDYNTLTVAGAMNPDGEVEWQDLGSLASCQMAYVAQAISHDGLSWPVPELPLPGAIETTAIRYFFEVIIGIPIPLPVMKCKSVDDAFIGMGWGEILALEVFGIPWYEIAEFVGNLFPGLWADLLGGMMDDFQELELGAVVLCYYAQIAQDEELYSEVRQTLNNLIEIQKILANLVYGKAANPDNVAQVNAELGPGAMENLVDSTEEMLYKAATYARMFNIPWPLEDFNGFIRGDEKVTYIESQLTRADTTDWPLITDDQIAAQVEARLAGWVERAPWRIERYRDRFGSTYPVRRDGDGYECIGTDDNWQPTENARHEWFVDFSLWFEAPLCVFGPETLDCTWARLGCAPGDLDDSGEVDAADQALFDEAWTTYGSGAACSAVNDWCDGADFDQSGVLDEEDQAYLNAAQGCTT